MFKVRLLLQNDIENRQISALMGKNLNYACFNTQSFRDYFQRICREAGADGFFWDDPHYAFPKFYAIITCGASKDWTCRCPVCMKKFQDYYGYMRCQK